MHSSSIIYLTGISSSGKPLLGGVWTLWEQEGFPLEMSHLICQESGWGVDWFEAMVDASVSNNCPALMKHIESFLPGETLLLLKINFMAAIQSGKSYQQLLSEKRANGVAFEAFRQLAIQSITINANVPSPSRTLRVSASS